jgi:O-antigen/teichoic acid export membrane protein
VSKNVLINAGGAYLNIAFATFYTIFLARSFDRVEFGVLSVLLVFSYVLANVFNFGMPASIYAHLPEIAHDPKKAVKFLKSNLLLLVVLAITSLSIIFMASSFLDTHIFKLKAPPVYYALALTGTFFYIIQNFARDALNAIGDFLHINIAQNISNMVKTALLVFLALSHRLTIGNALFIMGVLGPAVVFAIIIYERKWIIRSLFDSEIARSSIKLGYTTQYFIASQLFALASRVDLFMVAYFLTPGDKGDYALAQRIVLAIVTTTDSITQVFSPQFAKVHSQNDVFSLLKKAFLYVLLPTALFIGVSIAPTYLYTLFFTGKFLFSFPVTRLLSLAYIPYNFAAILLLFFLYSIKKPVHVLISNLILVIILVVGDFFLVPKLGLYAPPLVSFIAFVSILIYLLLALLHYFKKSSKKAH